MHKLGFWILVVGPMAAFCARTVPFCNVSQVLVDIRSCDQVSGPEINCTVAVADHLKLLKRTHETYLNQYRRLGPSANYNNYKLIRTALREMLQEMQRFYSFIKETDTQRSNASDENCVNIFYFEKYMTQLKERDSGDSYEDWIDYYIPVIAALELLLGVLGNTMIVVIFIKHKDMRTGANKVILNLAVGDILLLITNIVLFYSRYRWISIAVADNICYIMSYSRTAGIASSVYSMVALSMLRFLVTASSPGSKTQGFLKKYVKIPVVLAVVWTLAALTGVFDVFDATRMCEFTRGTTRQYIKFGCICLLPLLAIAAFSVATSRVMHKSVKQLPGEQTPGMLREIRARQRGAKVILSLVVVFCVTYLPLNIHLLVGRGYDSSDQLYVFATQLLVPLNSCLNPLALCAGSGKFRMHFKNYLCKCCSRSKDSKATVEIQATRPAPRASGENANVR